MKVFTPHEQTPFPVQRGDSLLHRILKSGEPYLLTDAAGEQWSELIRNGLASGKVEEAPERPVAEGTKRRLIFFDGDPGDAVVTRPAIASIMLQRRMEPGEVGFVTPHGDWSLFPFAATPVFEFPITLRQAEAFDGWAEFNFRTQGNVDPVAGFSSLVRGQKWTEKLWAPCVPSMQRAASFLTADTGRPRVGLCPTTPSHYRSWYGQHACVVAAGLVEAGFDCYFLGPLNHRIEFRKDGAENALWGEGLYDLQGRFSTVEEYAGALANMDAVIAPDGGDLLMSCALELPTLGLFWCTRGDRYQKYAPTLKCLNARRSCSPCWCVGDKTACEEPYCLGVATIDPEDVVNATKSMLEASNAT